MKYIIIALLGGLATLMANQGIAVFNDGFRPIYSQYFEKKITRKELAAMSFAISFGLVVGFGIPTSIAASIILIHSILLATDIIGTFLPDNKIGAITSLVAGATYGVLILVGLEAIVDLFGKLPYNFLDPLGSVSSFVVSGFAIFPSVAVGAQHGFKKGVITGTISVLVYFLIAKFGVINVGENVVNLDPAGMALLTGVIIMVIFATSNKSEENTGSNVSLTAIFSNQVSRIQKNWWIFAIMGGLAAAAASMDLIAGDPASLALMADKVYGNATLTALTRGIGFVPLIFTTAIVTGVYSPIGCTFIFAAGIALHGNPLVAFIAGAVILVVEVFLIRFFAKIMDKFPGVRDMGEYIRTAMNKVLEIALLAGSIVSAETMAKGVGAIFVIGCFLINKYSKKPLVDLAVGPVAAIALGIILNILNLIGLWTIPVA